MDSPSPSHSRQTFSPFVIFCRKTAVRSQAVRLRWTDETNLPQKGKKTVKIIAAGIHDCSQQSAKTKTSRGMLEFQKKKQKGTYQRRSHMLEQASLTKFVQNGHQSYKSCHFWLLTSVIPKFLTSEHSLLTKMAAKVIKVATLSPHLTHLTVSHRADFFYSP